MSNALPILTDEEVSRCVIVEANAGFGSLETSRGHLPLRAMDVQALVS